VHWPGIDGEKDRLIRHIKVAQDATCNLRLHGSLEGSLGNRSDLRSQSQAVATEDLLQLPSACITNIVYIKIQQCGLRRRNCRDIGQLYEGDPARPATCCR